MESQLTVIGKEIKTDKNGINYAYVTVRNEDFKFRTYPDGSLMYFKNGKPSTDSDATPATSRIVPKSTSFNAYEASYLDNKPQFGWDFEIGESISGSIETREVQEYEVDGKKVNSCTVIVFGDSTSKGYELLVEKAFKNKNAILINSKSTNKITAKLIPVISEAERAINAENAIA